jgi:imidazolonepropionase
MNFVVATACIKMKMTLRKPSMPPPSMERTQWVNTHGSITVGKKSNFIITKPIPSYYHCPMLLK